MDTFDELRALIPEKLRATSGAVFNSGRQAFAFPSKIYVLGLNPGGAPERHIRETVDFHTSKVMGKPLGWAEYRDESWDGREPGSAPLQRRVLHFFSQLGLEAGKVPTTNLVFKRASAAADIARELDVLTESCWPFHQHAIDRLGVRVVLCFGQDAANRVRTKLGAHQKVDEFIESNRRGYRSTAYASSDGITVVAATHPSRFDWCSPGSDPTPMIGRVLQRVS